VFIFLLSGCLENFRTPTIREIYTVLENDSDSTQTFNFALETKDNALDWDSHTLDADASELIVVVPPENATPVAFHGEINGTERTYEFDDLDGTDAKICLTMYFNYQSHPQYDVYINRGTDLNCYEDIG